MKKTSFFRALSLTQSFAFSGTLRILVFCLMMLGLKGSLAGDPWGKDADLAAKNSNTIQEVLTSCQTPLVGVVGEKLIAFHQNVISPADGPRSNFRPSSSQYMLDAMRKYGFFQGFSMGCDRLMRENEDPWVYRTTINEAGERMKYDPVP